MSDSHDSSLFCTSCHYPVPTAEDRHQHYKSEWHRYNIKRRVAGLQSIPHAVFVRQLDLLQSKRESAESEKSQHHCPLCNKTFQSRSAFQAHENSKLHKKKLQAKGVAPHNNESEHACEEARETQPVSENKDEPLVDGEPDETDPLYMDESAAIPIGTCLFCRKEFSLREKKQYLDHMLKQHGFFIPFIDYLTDLDGFLRYCGEKIGVGRSCLYCSHRARFPSVSAVQQHMNQKSHCKIRLDTEEDEEEYFDFYTFPKEEEEEELDEKQEKTQTNGKSEKVDKYALPTSITGKQDSQSSIETSESGESANRAPCERNPLACMPKRRVVGMNDLGELVMTDGSTIGNRAYKNVYKQHVKTADTRESVLINQLAHTYRQLALTSGDKNSTALAIANNTKKDAPSRFRENWHESRRRKNDLKVGFVGNIQHHYRAQVTF